MKHDESQLKPLSHSGRIGIGWSNAGGEAGGLLADSYLAADGIVNILRVLEELEDEKLHGLTFVELNACSGGCVGGTLTVENAYIAMAKTKRLTKYQRCQKAIWMIPRRSGICTGRMISNMSRSSALEIHSKRA